MSALAVRWSARRSQLKPIDAGRTQEPKTGGQRLVNVGLVGLSGLNSDIEKVRVVPTPDIVPLFED
jgi:hypothetical protein